MDNRWHAPTLIRLSSFLVLAGTLILLSIKLTQCEIAEIQTPDSVRIEGIDFQFVKAHKQVMPCIREGLPDFESDGYNIDMPEFYIGTQTVTFLDFKPFFEKYCLYPYSRPLPTPYETCLLLEYLNSNPPEGADRLPKGSFAMPSLSQALSLFPSDGKRIDISCNPFQEYSDSAFMLTSRYSPDLNALEPLNGDPYSNWNGTRFELLCYGYRGTFISHAVRDEYLSDRKYMRDEVFEPLLSLSNSPRRLPIRLVYIPGDK